MGNKYLDTAFVDKAIKFAVDAHANTERRGKGFPYVIHVLEAMEIVATITNDSELLAAAALHDTVEDTNVTLDQIRAEFGERVAKLVETESDKGVENQPEEASWRSRKDAAIKRLANASHDAKIVALGDKLSNMRAIARDYQKDGDKLWSIFHAPNGKIDHEWHYRGLANSLSELASTDAYKEFSKHIEDVFGLPKPELINLNDYEESGAGFMAKSFNHKDGKRMMKLYEPYIPYSDIERELKASWSISQMGLKIPTAYRLITDGTRVGVEFERITPKRSFSRIISQEPKNLEKYAILFAQKCKELHKTQCNTMIFASAVDFFTNVIITSKRFNEYEKAKIIDFIKTIPPATTCLHGDMHIGNIITNEKDVYWIDLADFRYGNPLFDLGMFYLACHCNPDKMTQELFHISNDQMQEIWEIFIREYFDSNIKLEEINAQCAPIAALYMIMYRDKGAQTPGIDEYIQNNLLK